MATLEKRATFSRSTRSTNPARTELNGHTIWNGRYIGDSTKQWPLWLVVFGIAYEWYSYENAERIYREGAILDLVDNDPYEIGVPVSKFEWVELCKLPDNDTVWFVVYRPFLTGWRAAFTSVEVFENHYGFRFTNVQVKPADSPEWTFEDKGPMPVGRPH